MNDTQAAGLSLMFPQAPSAEHDASVFATKPLSLIAEQLGDQPMHELPDVPRMIREYAQKAKRLNRLNVLSDIADFMEDASPLECKHVINMLIDRVSALTSAMEYESHPFKCPCDSCTAARSDEHYDRVRDGS